jgi:membrane-associated phospholipid phosphatase
MAVLRGIIVRACVMLLVLACSSPAQLPIAPSDSRFWVAGLAATAGAVLVDEELRQAAARNQTSSLDRIADDVDPFGRARYLVPALVVGAVVPRLVGATGLSSAVVRIGLGYAVADGMESILKSAVGRHRPDSMGRPLQFRPTHLGDPWTSFPSAHTTHAMALATGIALEAHRPWVTALAFGVAGAVALQRVYTQAHWASDVTGSAVLAIGASATTVEWLARGGLRGCCRNGETHDTAVRLRLGAGAVAIAVEY